MKERAGAAWAAWLLAAIYYFYQYALRSAPAVMLPQLSSAFALDAFAVSSLIGLFYYGYSPFSLVAGVAIDRFGPRRVVPLGALLVGAGAILFSTGNLGAAQAGRFLQGAGGVFALVGAVSIVSRGFPASSAATLIGATQMFGMAGGSAGQFLVGPLIGSGMAWDRFWLLVGLAGLALSAALFFLLPRGEGNSSDPGWLREALRAMGQVFRNPQSILCGLIAGLFFIPTTIFDMIWGVRYLQEARGFEYATAVVRSALVPLGWMIGCPLLGWLSDRIGRRKPVIAGSGVVLLLCLIQVLHGSAGLLPPYVLALATGIASGAAMLPYTVIKEANPARYGGTATGVINFLNFTFSALLGPVFGWIFLAMKGRPELTVPQTYQATFEPMIYGVALAVALTFALKETGPAARRTAQEKA